MAGEIFSVSTSSLDYVIVNNILTTAPSAIVDLSPATYISGTFQGSGASLTNITASSLTSTVTSSFSVSSSYSITSSYSLNAGSSGTTLFTGSTYPITASWATNAINGGTQLITGSTYPITSSWSVSSSWAPNQGATTLFTGSTYTITSSQAVSASYAPEKATFLFTGSTYQITSSQAVSASWAPTGTSGTTLFTGSTYPITSSWSNNTITSSYSITSSNAFNAVSSSWCLTGSYFSFIYTNVTVSATFLTFSISSSWASQSLSSFYASASNISVSSSWASSSYTSSYLFVGTYPITSSWTNNIASTGISGSIYSLSSSFASSSLSSSWSPNQGATTLFTASMYQITSSQAISASWAPEKATFLFTGSTYQITASQAVSASWAPGGSRGTTLFTGSTYPITSSWSNNSISSSFSLTSSFAYDALGTPTIVITAPPYNAIAGYSTDATTIIQSAIDYLNTTSLGGIVFIPAGVYRVTGSIYMKTGVALVGEKTKAQLTTGTVFQRSSTTSSMVYMSGVNSVKVKDICFYGGDSVLGSGLTVLSCSYFNIENCDFRNFLTGSGIYYSWIGTIRDCNLVYNSSSIMLDNQANQITISENDIAASNYGINALGLQPCYTVDIRDNDLEANNTAVYIGPNCNNFTVQNNHMESEAVAAIVVSGSRKTCILRNTYAGGSALNLMVTSSNAATIADNLFYDATTAMVLSNNSYLQRYGNYYANAVPIIVESGTTFGFVNESNTSSFSNLVRATASWASSSITSSYALNSPATTLFTASTYQITSSQAISSSYFIEKATFLFTGSTYQITSSQAVSASWAPEKATFLFTGSTYQITASQAVSASWAPGGQGGGTTLFTGSTYQITSSWTNNVISSSFSSTANTINVSASGANIAYSIALVANSGSGQTLLIDGSDLFTYNPATETLGFANLIGTSSWASQSISASWAPGGQGGGTTLFTGSTYQITSSWAVNTISTTLLSLTSSISSSWASQSLSSSWPPPVQNGQTLLQFTSWNNEATASVTGQSNIKTTSIITATYFASNDDIYANDWDSIIIRNIVTGSGFTITIRPEYGNFSGSVPVNWHWI